MAETLITFGKLPVSNESSAERTTRYAGGLEAVIDRIEQIYRQIDRETAVFSTATGMRCPEGCGMCCQSEKVEASVLEMLPLARELFRSGEIDLWMGTVFSSGAQGTCLLFRPDPIENGRGRCRYYTWRPLLCRLYGFAAVHSKYGLPVYNACRMMKMVLFEAVRHAAASVAEGLPALLIPEVHLTVAAVDPVLGNPPLPINQALRRAVEHYGLAWDMARAAGAEPRSKRQESLAKDSPADWCSDDPHGRVPPKLAA